VIISKEMLKDKVNNFIIENHVEQLNKDPTEAYKNKSSKQSKNAIG
jgi:hypothetical protein